MRRQPPRSTLFPSTTLFRSPPQRRPMPGRLTENTASWLAVATAITACSLRGFVQGVSITQSLSAMCSAAPGENWNDGMESNHPSERQQIRPLPSRRISPVFSRLSAPPKSFVGLYRGSSDLVSPCAAGGNQTRPVFRLAHPSSMIVSC